MTGFKCREFALNPHLEVLRLNSEQSPNAAPVNDLLMSLQDSVI